MSERLIVEGPINALSLGNVTLCLLKAAYRKGLAVDFVPVGGNLDLSAWSLESAFQSWLLDSANRFISNYNRNSTHLKIWHINGGQSWIGGKRILLTFHECDAATEAEINIVKNTDKTFFCGEYSRDVFSDYGLLNIESFNLGFDKDTFSPVEVTQPNGGQINWLLAGKAEKRKHSYKLLELWIKKFGKRRGQTWKDGEKHFLNVAITNPFFNNPELQNFHNQQIANIIGNNHYWNVHFHPWMQTNAEVNKLLNITDIDITGLSGAESWNLPAFNATCLGKWSAVLNATGHKSWANRENAVLVNPNGKAPLVDNIFFQPNAPFNNGNFYTFKDEDVLTAFDKLAKLAKTPNKSGLELQTKFTYEQTLDDILSKI